VRSYSFLLDYPTGTREGLIDETFPERRPKQVIIVADGEGQEEAEARARQAAWLGERKAVRLQGVIGEGDVPGGFRGPFTDIRGKEMFPSVADARLQSLPSRFRLLERLNFHSKNPFGDIYTPVSVGPAVKPLWEIYYAGRFEWQVFAYGQESRSREEAIEIVKGLDKLRVLLMWMAGSLTSHERDELRRIQKQL
jgi:hypothetical protein